MRGSLHPGVLNNEGRGNLTRCDGDTRYPIIPGTTKMHRLEEDLGATTVELTAEDLREIDRAASRIEVQGTRYPETLEKLTGR